MTSLGTSLKIDSYLRIPYTIARAPLRSDVHSGHPGMSMQLSAGGLSILLLYSEFILKMLAFSFVNWWWTHLFLIYVSGISHTILGPFYFSLYALKKRVFWQVEGDMSTVSRSFDSVRPQTLIPIVLLVLFFLLIYEREGSFYSFNIEAMKFFKCCYLSYLTDLCMRSAVYQSINHTVKMRYPRPGEFLFYFCLLEK